MFTPTLVIATLVAASLGAALALLLSHAAARHVITRLRAQLADVVWQLAHDPLTGLRNRSGLQSLNTAAAFGTPEPFAVVLVDLDLFKQVNDTHGHDAGDQLLKATAARIKELSTVYGGNAARLAGDEFVVTIPLRQHSIGKTAEHFNAVIAEPVGIHTDTGPVAISVTASLGIAVVPSSDLAGNIPLHYADTAVYYAKQQGGNRYVLHWPGMTMPTRTPRSGPRPRDLRRGHGGSAE